jgi:copper chaperone CopZ
LTLSAVAGLVLAAVAVGQPPSPPAGRTAITVEEMHCAGCARRIGNKLAKVPGVAAVQFDVKSKTLWVTPRPGQSPSPRGLWEAVEQAADLPVRLQGPGGTFTAKPES